MPQLQTNRQQVRQVKDYLSAKTIGAEFILPWAIDTFFQAIANFKKTFTSQELKALLETHKNLRLLPDHARISYLVLRFGNLCETDGLHKRYGINRANLEAKLRRLDDPQATALMVWASAFWVNHDGSAKDMDSYIKNC